MTFVKLHQPCPECGSSDALSINEDGSAFCFSCNDRFSSRKYTALTGEEPLGERAINVINNEPLTFAEEGEYVALRDRSISQDTAKKYGVRCITGPDGSIIKHLYPYYKDKEIVAYKERVLGSTGKENFFTRGAIRESGLFGEHIFQGGGKYVTLVEGECDAMAAYELTGSRWPVVSIKNGAQSAAADVKKNLEFLSSFENVIICFDSDKAGRDAAKTVAGLFPPNKAKICTLPLKDANEMVLAGKVKELTDCIWSSKAYRPDGIILGADIWNDIQKEDEYVTAKYPFECMNVKTHGLRKGELVTVTAGSGVGKSSFCRHIALSLLEQKYTVGYIALEESVKRSALGIMGVHLKKPLHLTREGVDAKQLHAAFSTTIGNGNFYLYNHFGSTVADNLLSKIRYLAKACNVDWVILDHLHMALSALGDEHTNDERKLIDYFVSKLRTLVEETGIGLILVSHLRRSTEGDKGFEDGKQVTLSSLRGSQSIAQLSDLVISMSRDLKAENNIAKISILKNRFSRETGSACSLHYDLQTGCLSEVKAEVLDDF